MEDEREKLKKKIIELIDKIERTDMLEYLFYFIKGKIKVG